MSPVTSGTDNREADVTQTMQGGFHKPSSGKERTLQGVKTYVYVGTEVRAFPSPISGVLYTLVSIKSRRI